MSLGNSEQDRGEERKLECMKEGIKDSRERKRKKIETEIEKREKKIDLMGERFY